MRYRIFPPIGIARLGEDDDFILGAERPGAGPGELQPNGSTLPVRRFKDASRQKIRKQGARFHLFQSEDGANWRPAELPAGSTVTWSVTLVNKKSAVNRNSAPPTQPTRPTLAAGSASMIINGGRQQISGNGAVSAPLVGTFATTAPNGTPYATNVELGRLRTDGAGRLIVLGGKGFSSAPPGVALPAPGGNFYRNPKWHDDVADGPVNAEIRLPGAPPIQAEAGAWVMVGPPDYAPGIESPITLYDVVREVGIDKLGLTSPARPSFDTDIATILARVRRLQFVHEDATWSDLRLVDPQLRNAAPAARPLREKVLSELVLRMQAVFRGHILSAGPPYRLRKFQRKFLDDWAQGNFDGAAVPVDTAISAEGLTRAALETASGQGFCPGIEAGILLLDHTIYTAPFDFRLDHAQLQAGDLTALMAQPWQADFHECNTQWWPTQRPDIAPQSGGGFEDWNRGANSHELLVKHSGRLGFIVQQGNTEVFLEAERDPTLPG
jgi:hypothetical protein